MVVIEPLFANAVAGTSIAATATPTASTKRMPSAPPWIRCPERSKVLSGYARHHRSFVQTRLAAPVAGSYERAGQSFERAWVAVLDGMPPRARDEAWSMAHVYSDAFERRPARSLRGYRMRLDAPTDLRVSDEPGAVLA